MATSAVYALASGCGGNDVHSGSGGGGATGGAGSGNGGGTNGASDAAAVVAPDPACATIATGAQIRTRLRFTADNECEIFVNGTSVGSTTNWTIPVIVDVSLFLYPGRKNVIAVTATNTSSQGGNDRGIIGDLVIDNAGSIVLTDKTWRVSKTADADWTSVSFDDSAWIAATEIARNGDAPWMVVIGSSPAKWIWSTEVPVSTAEKPDIETAYARKSFYFSTNGRTVGSTPGCP